MQDIIPFSYEGNEIRVIKDHDGNPWWVAKDVCEVLEIEKYRDAISRLDEDERGSVKVDTLGGPQEMGAINESGLYTLILRSNKPEAKPFRKWVTSEVLPSIRKNGGYSFVAPRTIVPIAREFKAAVAMARTLGLDKEQAIFKANQIVKQMTGVDCISSFEVKRYVKTIDPDESVVLFISEECVLGEGNRVLPKFLFRAYRSWSHQGGMPKLSISKFYGILKEQFKETIQRERLTDDTRYFLYGVALHESDKY